MANTDRICRKGFILAPSPTDGELVPFFVQVREKDIIWNESDPPEVISGDYLTALEKSYTRMDECWSFKSDDWDINYHSSGNIEMSTRVNIRDEFAFINQNMLQYWLGLEFPILDDSNLTLGTTIVTDSNAIRSSTVSLDTINDRDDRNIITAIHLNLCNFTTPFSPTKSNIDDYSYINIHLSGKVAQNYRPKIG